MCCSACRYPPLTFTAWYYSLGGVFTALACAIARPGAATFDLGKSTGSELVGWGTLAYTTMVTTVWLRHAATTASYRPLLLDRAL